VLSYGHFGAHRAAGAHDTVPPVSLAAVAEACAASWRWAWLASGGLPQERL